MQPTRSPSPESARQSRPSLLRAVQLALVAIVTLVAAGLLGPGTSESSVGVAVDGVSAVSSRWASPPAPVGAPAFKESAPSEGLEQYALEADLDDDDIDGDRELAAVGHDIDAATGMRSPLASRLASRAEPRPDPSRFAIGHGFARGPPA